MKNLDKKRLLKIHLIFVFTTTLIISFLLILFFFLNASEIAKENSVRNDLNTILLGISLIFSIFLTLLSYYNYKDYLKKLANLNYKENVINLDFYLSGHKNFFKKNILNIQLNSKLLYILENEKITHTFDTNDLVFYIKEGYFRYYIQIISKQKEIKLALKVDKDTIFNSNMKKLLEQYLKSSQIFWEI